MSAKQRTPEEKGVARTKGKAITQRPPKRPALWVVLVNFGKGWTTWACCATSEEATNRAGDGCRYATCIVEVPAEEQEPAP